MKFECGDLERALAVPELMTEAREHLKTCANCRREYKLWTDISTTARDLHEEWDSPGLWSEIRKKLDAEPKPKPARWNDWRAWAVAATVVVGTSVGIRQWIVISAPPAGSNTAQVATAQGSRGFLTDQALQEVEKNEAAYRRSIEKLSQLAEPKLHSPVSAMAMNCKEKLLMLDSAISETRSNLNQNRFNVHLQTELADLYREKQQTLQELLTRDKKN
jgi:hypothetical protein